MSAILSKLWPVLVDNASEALILEGGAPVPSGWSPIPIYAAAGTLAKAIAFRFGSSSFKGNGGGSVALPGIGHGLPSGFGLVWVEAITSLQSADGAWFAQYGQYRAADTDFYLEWQLAPNVSGAGGFDVSGGGTQTIDGNFLVSGGSTSGSGGVSGSSEITGSAILGTNTFDDTLTYYFNWMTVGLAL